MANSNVIFREIVIAWGKTNTTGTTKKKFHWKNSYMYTFLNLKVRIQKKNYWKISPWTFWPTKMARAICYYVWTAKLIKLQCLAIIYIGTTTMFVVEDTGRRGTVLGNRRWPTTNNRENPCRLHLHFAGFHTCILLY